MDQTTWKLLEIGGNWVSGVGSLLAVWVALRIAKKQTEVKLAVVAGERALVDRVARTAPMILFVQVTNIGQAPATITNVGWEQGVISKRYGIQMLEQSHASNTVPIDLTTGKQATFTVPFDGTTWLPDMVEWLDGWFPRFKAWDIKVCIYTSVGTTVKQRLEPALRKKLLEEHQKLLAQKRASA